MDFSKILGEKTGTLIGLLSLAVAITVAVLQFRPRSRQLTCNVTSTTELTSVSQVPGLASEFSYQGKKVTHLWKITLSYVNSGNETIVGEGKQSTLLSDQLLFSFPESTEILNLELTNTDLPLQSEVKPPNLFSLRFSQWRPDEKANLSVYVTSQAGQASPLIPQTKSRDIVDGEIIITNAINPILAPKTSLERLPNWISILVRVILSAICVLLVFAGYYFFPRMVLHYFRIKLWKKRYGEKYKGLVDQLTLDQTQKQIVLADPTRLADSSWKTFDLKKPQVDAGAENEFSSTLQAIVVATLSLVVGTASLVYMSSNVFDLFQKVRGYFS